MGSRGAALSLPCQDGPCLPEFSLHPVPGDSLLSGGYGRKELGCLWTWPGSSRSLGLRKTEARGLLFFSLFFPSPSPHGGEAGPSAAHCHACIWGCLAPQGLGRGTWEASRVHMPTLGCPLALSPQLREAAVLRTVVEAQAQAQAAEGVHPRAPRCAQPPSVTERPIDLHYGFPGSFPRREIRRPRESAAPCQASPAESGLFLEPGCPGSRLGSPFVGPPEPTSLGSQALRLPQVFLAAACPSPAPIPGQAAPPGFSCRAPPSQPLTSGNGALLALPLAPSWTAALSAMGHFWASDLGQREVSAPFPWPWVILDSSGHSPSPLPWGGGSPSFLTSGPSPGVPCLPSPLS